MLICAAAMRKCGYVCMSFAELLKTYPHPYDTFLTKITAVRKQHLYAYFVIEGKVCSTYLHSSKCHSHQCGWLCDVH